MASAPADVAADDRHDLEVGIGASKDRLWSETPDTELHGGDSGLASLMEPCSCHSDGLMSGSGVPSARHLCSCLGSSPIRCRSSPTASYFTGNGARRWGRDLPGCGYTPFPAAPFRCVKPPCGISFLWYSTPLAFCSTYHTLLKGGTLMKRRELQASLV